MRLVGFLANRIGVHQVLQLQGDNSQSTEIQLLGGGDQDRLRVGLHLLAKLLSGPGDHRHVWVTQIAVGECFSRQR
jgi:hypothetical protein